MGEILGIGCSHGPGVAGPVESILETYLRFNLRSEHTPAEMKDPKSWPKQMQEEWGDDEGLTTATLYREKLVAGYRAARQRIDEFNPDVIVMFGDDQYEAFKKDLILPFCVFAIEEGVEAKNRGNPIRINGFQDVGNHIARELIRGGFDVGCSWELHHGEEYGHAFTTTVRGLDQDGQGFHYPVIPIAVNCYGSDLRIPGPGQERAKGRRQENMPVIPPPSPPPWRCYDLGREVARILEASPWKAVVIGSSSWSHASLTAKHHYLWPDIEADRERRAELEAGEQAKWRDLDPEQIADSGQHEILNWVCLAGAMEGRKANILSYAEAYIDNSSKCVALFEP